METINNLANAAAKAVWGEGEANKEPISGERGDVSTGQPYDAGNLEASEQRRRSNAKLDPSHSTEPGATAATDPTSTSTSTSTDKGTIASASNPAISSTAVGDADSASKPSVTDSSGEQPNQSDTTAGQNDTRDPDDENAEIEPKGPGPRPLNVVAKEHGGDAGRDHEAGSKDTKPSSSSSEDKPGEEATADPESLGSGKQYVKTSGLAADGGDFDVTKPGAGREADRLLDEKGLHHGEDKGKGSHHGHTKDKPSLGERIKAKLHKH